MRTSASSEASRASATDRSACTAFSSVRVPANSPSASTSAPHCSRAQPATSQISRQRPASVSYRASPSRRPRSAARRRCRRSAFGAAACIQRRMSSRSRDHRVERLADLLVVGALRHVAHGAPERRVGQRRRRIQDLGARVGDQRAGGGVVEDGELARDIRLERELVQQPFAEGVDGLDFQPARRFQRAGEEPPRLAHLSRSGAWPCNSSIARASSASGSMVHLPSVSKTRRAISAAATFVKVRQRMAAGSAPASISRITRCVSTCVLPEPALATTQAEDAGRRPRAGSRACDRNRASRAHSSSCSSSGRHPFGDAGEMVVVADIGAAALAESCGTDSLPSGLRTARRASVSRASVMASVSGNVTAGLSRRAARLAPVGILAALAAAGQAIIDELGRLRRRDPLEAAAPRDQALERKLRRQRAAPPSIVGGAPVL